MAVIRGWCTWCGQAFDARKRSVRFCSRRCVGLWRESRYRPSRQPTISANGCIIPWQKPSGRYCRIVMGGKVVSAHRHAWEVIHGPIPEGMVVCHKCDNPPCINPDHLFLGTQSENMLDCVAKGRHARAGGGVSGEGNSSAKLTWDKVNRIRAQYAAGGVRQIDLAAEFCVSRSAVAGVLQGRRWEVPR